MNPEDTRCLRHGSAFTDKTTVILAVVRSNAYATLHQYGAAGLPLAVRLVLGEAVIMRGVLRLAVFPMLAALGGCGDTEYKGNMLLTDPARLSARLFPGVTHEAEVSTLLSGSETEQHSYGVIGPDGQFVGCAQNDQQASEKCPFVQRQYITLRKRTGRFLIPNQTDAWRALLVFDGTGVLRAVRQDYFEGPWDWLGIR